MKKFLFTLAALLMAATAFAQTDAKYLYVNSELTVEDPDVENGLILTISAEFPGRLNAMECNLILPEGLTCTMLEVGPDAEVSYVDSRGRSKSADPSLSTIDNLHFVMLAPIVDGFWQDPNGENPTAWVRYGAAKWEAGDYEEFVYAYVEYDDTYHGGQAYVQTIPSSGVDSRGETIADMGDKSREDIITPATEPLEDPNPAQAPDAPVITFSGEETTTMTVTVTAAEGCTLIVNGEAVEGNPYSYTVDRDDIYTPGTVNVTAKAVKDGLESVEASDSKDFVVADFPVADQPVINFVETKNDNDEVVSVEVVVTNATSYTITVDGEPLRGEVIPASYEADKAIHVEAVNAPGYPYEENTNEADYTLVKLAKKAVADPVINTTMDDDYVYVTIQWPAETDGNQVYTGEYQYERTDVDQTFDVEAYVEEGTEWLPSGVVSTTIEVPAKNPAQAPDAPVITFSGEETTTMTVTVTAAEGCTLIVNGEAVEGNPYSYTVDRDDIYTPGTVNVTAKAVKDGLESVEASDSKDFVVADFPVADQPVINFVETKNDNDEVVSVEVVVTNATSYTITVDGEPLRGEVIPASYEADKAIHVEAVNAPGYPYEENTNEADYTLVKLAKKAVADPVINQQVNETTVTVTITWPEETDGNQVYTGEYTYNRTYEDQSFPVEAYVEEGTEWLASGVTEATINVPAMAKKDVAAPVITTTMDDDNVYVNIQWPAETDGEQMYNGEYTYERTYEDQSFPVEAYVTEGTEWKESEHATPTIVVPAKPVPTPVIDVAPVSGNGTADGKGYYQITITDAVDGAEILYQITYPDGTQSGWMPYDAAFAIKQGDGLGDYVIEAKAVVGDKESEVASVPFNLSETTGVEMLNGEKAVAGVRYFNLAGQEMQEANGMTIVVTTYTDGTTSAVKVMK